MTVYRHLGRAIEIMRREPDPTKWGPMIDRLSEEEQAECRPWLREQAKRVLRIRRSTAPFPPRPSGRGSKA